MTASDVAEASDAKITTLPTAGEFKPGRSSDAADAEADSDGNGVFSGLVTGDSDIVGLVAYSIYKQNKHDWLIAFTKTTGRKPNDGEMNAYIIGESTPRRLATYRHLAEATLEGRGPVTPAGVGPEGLVQRSYAIAARHAPAQAAPQRNWGAIGLAGLAFVVVVGLYLAARYGLINVK